jgi:hypothetical protein
MTTVRMATRLIGVASLVAMTLLESAAAEEKLVGTYGEVRTVLAFKASPAAVQKLLPEGWESAPIAGGPSKDANLNVVFMDWITVTNPDGTPGNTARIAAIVAPARKKGTQEAVPMVVSGLAPGSFAPGPYGTEPPAKVTVDRHERTDASGTSTAEEAWEYVGDGGDKIQLQLRYTRGVAERSKIEAKPHSPVKPEFYRIYRIEQAADVVRSTVTGVDRVQNISFTASGPKLSQLFDCKEEVVSITSLPWYSRQVTLPAGMPASVELAGKQ